MSEGTDPRLATLLGRGICRAFDQFGHASLVEFPLVSGRRADVLALSKTGEFTAVEIKISIADFRADHKWAFYRDFSDRLYFAVPADFPSVLIPEECGLMVADGFGSVILRQAPLTPLAPARRRALTLRFAIVAATRLRRQLDPQAAAPRGG